MDSRIYKFRPAYDRVKSQNKVVDLLRKYRKKAFDYKWPFLFMSPFMVGKVLNMSIDKTVKLKTRKQSILYSSGLQNKLIWKYQWLQTQIIS